MQPVQPDRPATIGTPYRRHAVADATTTTTTSRNHCTVSQQPVYSHTSSTCSSPSSPAPALPPPLQEVLREFPDVRLAYGESDEYSFVLHPEAALYGGCVTPGHAADTPDTMRDHYATAVWHDGVCVHASGCLCPAPRLAAAAPGLLVCISLAPYCARSCIQCLQMDNKKARAQGAQVTHVSRSCLHTPHCLQLA